MSSFTTGVQIANYTDEANNGQYICVKTADTAGNISYAASSNDLNIDITPPEVSSITLSDPSPTKDGTVTFTVNFNEPMDTNTNPTVSFGLASPFNQHAVSTNPTWTDADTFTAEIAIADGGTWDGTNTISVSAGKDAAGNTMSANTATTFVIDTTEPTSSVTTPGTGTEQYSVPTLSGSASDSVALSGVQVSIKDATDGTHWWDGDGFDATEEYWLSATGTTSWSYNSSAVAWQVNSAYLIKSKATDTAGNTSTDSGITFTFINQAPVVTNVTASQGATGTVTVGYDVADSEGDSTTVGLFYDSGATLASAILNGSSTSDIQTSSGARFPASGTILIKYENGDNDRYEYIAYTGKSGDDLTGVTRAQEGTLGYAHAQGEQIWIKAATVAGDTGAVADGAGKSITWTAATDTAFYDGTMNIRVSSNDGASANNIGVGDSSDFVFDTADPTITTTSIDATANPAELTFSVTDDTALEMMISLNNDFSGASWVAYSANPTITLASNPDTVYAKFKDGKGNETETQELTTPNTPGSLMAQDISSVAQNKWRIYLSWQIITVPTPGFDKYLVYRSATSGGTYSYLGETAADNINADYYSDTVTQDATWCYKVAAKDDDGNISFLSGGKCTSANGTQDEDEGGGGASGDETAPEITSGPTATPASNSATIVWVTGEAADSYVEYGLDTDYGSVFGTPDLTTDHSIQLPAVLTSETIYHYRVRTRDAAGNLTTSTDATFTTAAGGGDSTAPTISNITDSPTTSTSVTVSWDTNENANGLVDYGPTTAYGTTIGDTAESSQTHSVTIPNLTPGATYYYRVRSTDAAGNEAIDDNGGSGYTFSPYASPVITWTGATATDDTAEITYTTSSNAYGFVDYGTTGSYGTVKGNDGTLATNHSVTLTGLAAGTTYHYRARIKDTYGNYTYDETDRTFVTNSSDAPGLESFTSTTADGTYGPADTINVTATYSENIEADSAVTVTLNTGASVTLDTITDNTKLTGTYTVGATGANQNTTALAVATITIQNVCDADSNCNHSVTVPETNIDDASAIQVDTTAPVFSNVSPAADSTINSITTASDVSYTLSEAVASGSITITRTGGTADNNSPHTCTLVGTAKNSGTHTNFDMSDTTNGCQSAVTLVSGTIYTFAFNGVDAVGNNAAEVSRTGITYDSSALTLQSFTSTTGAGTYGPTEEINITATYSENLAAGSTITIELDNGASVTLSTINTNTLTGTYTVGATGSGEDSAALVVDSITSQDVTDAGGNNLSSTTLPATNIAAGIIIDTTAPTFSNLSPANSATIDNVTDASDISYTVSEDLQSGTITITRTAGTADGTSPHTCTLAGTYLQTGGHNNFDTTNCSEGAISLVDNAYYTISFQGEDAGGNSAEEAERTGVLFSAGVDLSGPEISNIQVSSVTTTTATITWVTDEAATSLIDYGTEAGIYDFTIGSATNFVSSHSVTLYNLTAGTSYYFRVRSADAVFNETIDDNNGGDYTFDTESAGGVTFNDDLAQTVSSSSVTFTWTTSGNAYPYVYWGATIEYGNMVGKEAAGDLAESHSVTISGLNPRTTYHFRPRVKDALGNYTLYGSDVSVTTTATSSSDTGDSSAPDISSVDASAISSSSATIEWSTDENTNGIVKYGLTDEYDQAAADVLTSSDDSTEYDTSHSVRLTGLLSNTTYHYSVVSYDIAGNTAISSDETFSTAELSSISEVKVTNITLNSATITLVTQLMVAWLSVTSTTS